MKIAAERRAWAGRVDLYMGQNMGNKLQAAQPLVFADIEEGTISDPFISLYEHDAQLLMDQLWTCGLRPTEGSGSAGSLRATERHLEDMRTLVFSRDKPT